MARKASLRRNTTGQTQLTTAKMACRLPLRTQAGNNAGMLREAMPKMGLEVAGLLQDGVINVEKLSAMAEAEAPKKPPRSTHEQEQQFQIGTDKPNRESQIGTRESKHEFQIGTSESQIGNVESQIGTNPPQNLGDNQTPDHKHSIDQIDLGHLTSFGASDSAFASSCGGV